MNGNPDLLATVQDLKGLLVSASRGQARSPEENTQYQQLRTELIQNPDLQPLLTKWLREYRGIGEFWHFIKSQSTSYAGRQEFLRTEFEPALAALEGLHQSGQLFFPEGSDHDAFVEVRNVIRNATNNALIVDPWVDETLWPLLMNLPSGARVRVLSNNMKEDFCIEARKFSKQHGVTVDVRKSTAFHDRFIVTDGSRCWHLGASIKDAGAKAFLLSEIMFSTVRDATISAIEAEWTTATIVPI